MRAYGQVTREPSGTGRPAGYSVARALRAALYLRGLEFGQDAGAIPEECEREIAAHRALRDQSAHDRETFHVPPGALLRSLNVGTPSEGGALVSPADLEYVGALRPRPIVAELGARIVPGLVGTVRMPRGDAVMTTAWGAEGFNSTESNPTFQAGETLEPKEARGFVDITRKLRKHGGPALDAFITAELEATAAHVIDQAALAGAGGDAPLGVANHPDVPIVAIGANGGASSWQLLTTLRRDVALTSPSAGSFGIATNPQVEKALSDVPQFSNAGTSAWEAASRQWRTGVSASIPANLTKGSAAGVCSAILAGEWSDLIVGVWGVEIMPDPLPFATAGGVRIHVFVDVGVALRSPASFRRVLDVTTS